MQISMSPWEMMSLHLQTRTINIYKLTPPTPIDMHKLTPYKLSIFITFRLPSRQTTWVYYSVFLLCTSRLSICRVLTTIDSDCTSN